MRSILNGSALSVIAMLAADKEGNGAPATPDNSPKARAKRTARIIQLDKKTQNVIDAMSAELRKDVDEGLEHERAVGVSQQKAAHHIVTMAQSDGNVMHWLKNKGSEKFSVSALFERVYGKPASNKNEDEGVKKERLALENKRRAFLTRAVAIAKIVVSTRAKGASFDKSTGVWSVPSAMLLGKGQKFTAKQPKFMPLTGAQVAVQENVRDEKTGVVTTKNKVINLSGAQLTARAPGARGTREEGADVEITVKHLDKLTEIMAQPEKPYQEKTDKYEAFVTMLANAAYHYKKEFERAMAEAEIELRTKARARA